MPVATVVGVQWGDEGKGKVVDYLTSAADVVVRFQGGNNAGHTLVIDGKKTALRLIPSGIMRPNTRCLIASGVVLDPDAFLGELEELKQAGLDVSPSRLGVAGEVQLILPYHKALDKERETKLAENKIGTTGKGIGPAYEDAVSRCGVRACDLKHPYRLRDLIHANVEIKNKILKHVFDSEIQFDAECVLADLERIADRISPYLTNVSLEVEQAIKNKKVVVFEGAQGTLLDVAHGTYPYVTSSNTLAAFACASAGIGPRQIDLVLGICKAYCTRVGGGPFPSEDCTDQGDRLRAVGCEFGTVTGRPRRCGWLDLVALEKAIRLNGVDYLFITKLDVLSGFPKIKIAVSYSWQGSNVDAFPCSGEILSEAEVTYEELDGWSEDLGAVRDFKDLPTQAQAVLSRIEQISGRPIAGFSVGPDREQTVVMRDEIRWLLGPA